MSKQSVTGNGARVLWSVSILRALFLRYYTRKILSNFLCTHQLLLHIEKEGYNKDVMKPTNNCLWELLNTGENKIDLGLKSES